MKTGNPLNLGQALTITARVFVFTLTGIFVVVYGWLYLSERRGPYHNTTYVADLDGDGLPDVILSNLRQEAETIHWGVTSLWFNDSSGRFTPSRLDVPPHLFVAAAAMDTDRDGDQDLLLLSVNSVFIFHNQGGLQEGQEGEFKHIGAIGPSEDHGTQGDILLADLNGDGQDDLFIAGCCSMYVPASQGQELYIPSLSWAVLQKWNPAGWMDRQVKSLRHLGDLRMRGAALGDLDGDGNLDLFATILFPKGGRGDNASDRIFFNDGAGDLHDSGQRLGDSDSLAVALADLDGDGDLDALVGTEAGGQVWINQGGIQGGQAGVFTAGAKLPYHKTVVVFLDDLDGNGTIDALLGGQKQASVWWNDGQGSFTRSQQSFSYSERHGLALADFDKDGLPDLFAAAYTDHHRVWLNQGDGTFR
jgi:hypothetical protein